MAIHKGDFEEDIEIGKIGESIAKKILLGSPKTKSIIDCSSDKYFQDKDIDFLAEQQDGRVLKCEVKTDTQSHSTGNMVFELSTSGNIGCLAKTNADFIFYYSLGDDTMYGYLTTKMRSYISHHKELKKIEMGDSAEGYLLNIRRLIRDGVVYSIKYQS